MSPTSVNSSAYRPHLDGIRALAVYLVVVFHAGIDGLGNGFIGVDIFFVLSGYLVTGILVRDLEGPERNVAFCRFYSRRARRLLPAAAINLLVTAIVFGAIAPPVDLEDARKGIRAASLYFANWHFIAQNADYFAADVNLNPVQHYWSLSIEEQYYFVWPILLAGLYMATRRVGPNQTRLIQFTIVSAAVSSYALARAFADEDLGRAYFGTDTRAYQLLAGAFLAVTPELMARVRQSTIVRTFPLLPSALVAGLVLLASPLVAVDPIWRGLIVTIITTSLIVLLEASSLEGVRRILSSPAFVYLGKISYGTYLWHWLIILVLISTTELAPVHIALVAVVLSTAMASLSYHLVELPIRTSTKLDLYCSAVLITALVISVFVGVVAAPALLERSSDQFKSAHEAGATATTPRPSNDEIWAAYQDYYDYNGCEVSGPVACPIVEGGSKIAIIVGESHAATLTAMLAEIAKRNDYSLYAGFLSFCPWTHGLRYDAKVGGTCFQDQDDLFNRIIPKLDPDIVFLAHRPVDDPQNSMNLIDRDLGKLGDNPERQTEALRTRITDLIRALRADGRTVVLFEPIPIVAKEGDTLTCLSHGGTVGDCQFVTRAGPGPQELIMRELASGDDRVISVDLDRLVCPSLPVCQPVVNGVIVKRDDNHLTIRFTLTLADSVNDYLVGKEIFR